MTTTATPVPTETAKPAKPAPTGPTAPAPAPVTPKLNLQSFLERLKLPGVDVEKLLAVHRKDLEALLAANERAFGAVESLTRKQIDMLGNVVREWQSSVRETIAHGSSAEKINQAGARVQNAFKQALTDMREMAEIAGKSSQEVLVILNKRYHEMLEELRTNIRAKS